MTTYATCRATLAAALAAALSDWSVTGYPSDNPDARSIGIATGTAMRVNNSTWRRELTVGVFVKRSTVAESMDLLDSVIPTISDTVYGVAGGTVVEVTEPRLINLADVDYLAQFIAVTIETRET
jgi:hypothetical protein